jgi:two-component system OmpR family sensor kinase
VSSLRQAREQVAEGAHRLGDRVSLRARLIAVVLALLAVALLLSGAATIAVLRAELIGRTDAELRTAADPDVLSALTSSAFRQNEPEHGPSSPSPYDITFIRLDTGQQLHIASTNEQAYEPRIDLNADRVRALGGEAFTVPSSRDDGPKWRVVATIVRVGDSPVIAAVARPLTGVEGTLAQMTGRLLLIGVVVLIAVALLALVAIRRAFRPLRQVESVATAFGQGDMSRRVRNDEPTTEVGRLGASVNAMLDSIETTLAAREASEARMRRFVADASHELRTPLASLRGFAELYRQGAISRPEDVARTFRRIEDESTRMGGLVEDLLLLARLDEQRPMRRDPVDMLVLAGDVVHDARALTPGRAVRLQGLDGDPHPHAAPTIGDDARLRQVLTNLVTNALRHTPEGSPIEIGVGVTDGWARWQVVDHGPGVSPEDAARIFERFYRADSSRSRSTGGGAGLGLAIVDGVTHAHGGRARVVPTPGGGATFEVALPVAPATVPGGTPAPQDAPPRQDVPPPQAQTAPAPSPQSGHLPHDSHGASRRR